MTSSPSIPATSQFQIPGTFTFNRPCAGNPSCRWWLPRLSTVASPASQLARARPRTGLTTPLSIVPIWADQFEKPIDRFPRSRQKKKLITRAALYRSAISSTQIYYMIDPTVWSVRSRDRGVHCKPEPIDDSMSKLCVFQKDLPT